MDATQRRVLYFWMFCVFMETVAGLSFPPLRFFKSVNATLKQESSLEPQPHTLYACAFDLPSTIGWGGSIVGIQFSKPIVTLKFSEFAQAMVFEDPGHRYYVFQNTLLNTSSSTLHMVFIWATVYDRDLPSAVCSIQVSPPRHEFRTSPPTKPSISTMQPTDMGSPSLSSSVGHTLDTNSRVSPSSDPLFNLGATRSESPNELTTEINFASIPRGTEKGQNLVDVYCDLMLSTDLLEPGNLEIEVELNRPVMGIFNWDFHEIYLGMSSTNFRFTNDVLFSALTTPFHWEFQINFLYFGAVAESGISVMDPQVPRGTCRYRIKG